MYIPIQIFHWLLLLVAVAGIVFCILLEGIVALDLLQTYCRSLQFRKQGMLSCYCIKIICVCICIVFLYFLNVQGKTAKRLARVADSTQSFVLQLGVVTGRVDRWTSFLLVNMYFLCFGIVYFNPLKCWSSVGMEPCRRTFGSPINNVGAPSPTFGTGALVSSRIQVNFRVSRNQKRNAIFPWCATITPSLTIKHESCRRGEDNNYFAWR